MDIEQELTPLHRISAILSSDRSLEEMLGEIIGLAAQGTACDACLVYLLDPESDEIVLVASQLPHSQHIGNLKMKKGEGLAGWVAENKSVVALARNAWADQRFKVFQDLVEDTYEACLSVPLVNQGEVIGVINIHHRESHHHQPSEIGLVTFVGEQMGSAIAKARLAEQNELLREEASELKRQLETRKLVERAKGILQKNFGLTEEEAYLRLRNESRRSRRPMKELAQAVILAEELGRSGLAAAPASDAHPDGHPLPGKPIEPILGFES